MKVKYCRVSTEGQSVERQLLDSNQYDKIYTESVSGSIVMEKRDIGNQLLTDIKCGKVNELWVEEISRIGRDALDVMRTLRLCEEMGVNVCISNLGIQSLTNGKRNDMFSLVSGIVLSLAENERRSIAERCLNGRVAARKRGVKFGRKQGIIESDSKFLSKPKVKEIVKDLKSKYPYSVIAKNRGCSISLVQKVNDKLRDITPKGPARKEPPKETIFKDAELPPTAFNAYEYYDEEMGVEPIKGIWNLKYDKPTGQTSQQGFDKK